MDDYCTHERLLVGRAGGGAAGWALVARAAYDLRLKPAHAVPLRQLRSGGCQMR
jgi:hypothetical protein